MQAMKIETFQYHLKLLNITDEFCLLDAYEIIKPEGYTNLLSYALIASEYLIITLESQAVIMR